MKSLRSKPRVALLLALTLFVGWSAFAGTKDGGGGGNIQKSTRADLQEVVDNLDRRLWEASDNYNFGSDFQLTSRPLKPLLRWVNRKVLGADHFTISESFREYVRGLKFEIHDQCFEGDEPRDASTLYEKNAPVCLSVTGLGRVPKSSLRLVLLPLIFHEVAHQFGFGEAEANALQALADLHLKYRPIYLAAIRGRFECAFGSKSLSEKQKNQTVAELPRLSGNQNLKEWPWVTGKDRLQVRNSCVAWVSSVGQNLERLYDGSVWAEIPITSLSATEKNQLLDYEHYPERRFTFETLKKSLEEPAITGYSDCAVCEAGKLDPYYIMMLGAKAAMEYIDHEVGRLQDQIEL